jgi:Asp-tRNA(Asn)/Glu-tRNA(Gln) amidotransferase A subunit family amidase
MRARSWRITGRALWESVSVSPWLRDVDVVITPNSALLLTNLTGHPQVSLPGGFTKRDDVDVPVSAQFIGRLYGESAMLRVAMAWQDATGHHIRVPPAFDV